ncbi:FkbM family methyltransferase [Labrys miyagiensis]|uniref:FkbM family methyltransferase n=1 Tax=Labrys miyagiensis TaxID=346912 RepID=UPI0024E1724E|nr:FkbM family methyltransferase [Labrys miyagiensis]
MPNYVIENSRIAAKWTRHGLFFFNRNDLFIGRSLDLYGEWCESEIQLLGQVLRPGDVALDIGANIGTHALSFAEIVGPGGRVYALEPQHHVFQLLCANAAVNLSDNLHCLNKAAGSEAGRIRLAVGRPDQAFNFGAARQGPEGEDVEVITVDGLDLPACRLIKVDVEGMEPAVLAGAARTIARHRPFVFVECNDSSDSRGIIGAMTSQDYDLWWHIAGYYSPANFLGNAVDIFGSYQPEANLFCAPRELGLRIGGLEACTGLDDNWRLALERLNKKKAE